jgi:hypothetical protein
MIVVKVWHDAKWRYVRYNEQTSEILRRLYHPQPGEYYNPTDSEWSILRQFKKEDTWREKASTQTAT